MTTITISDEEHQEEATTEAKDEQQPKEVGAEWTEATRENNQPKPKLEETPKPV